MKISDIKHKVRNIECTRHKIELEVRPYCPECEKESKLNEIKDISIIHYRYPDTIMYSGTIRYKDGELSGTVKKTSGSLTEWFIENEVPQVMWENCKIQVKYKW